MLNRRSWLQKTGSFLGLTLFFPFIPPWQKKKEVRTKPIITGCFCPDCMKHRSVRECYWQSAVIEDCKFPLKYYEEDGCVVVFEKLRCDDIRPVIASSHHAGDVCDYSINKVLIDHFEYVFGKERFYIAYPDEKSGRFIASVTKFDQLPKSLILC